jgi:hypothetical protein
MLLPGNAGPDRAAEPRPTSPMRLSGPRGRHCAFAIEEIVAGSLLARKCRSRSLRIPTPALSLLRYCRSATSASCATDGIAGPAVAIVQGRLRDACF